MGLEGFDGVFFGNLGFREGLVVIEVDEVGCPVVLASLAALWAVSCEMPYFSALEACVRRVSCGGCVALKVVLRVVSQIPIGVLSSSEVVPAVVPSVIPLGWRSVPVYIHRDWGIIHPSRGIR